MESINTSTFINFLELQQGEALKFAEGGVVFTLKNDDERQILIPGGVLVLTTQRVIYFSESAKKGIWFSYQNAITHGTNKLNLVIVMSYCSEAQEKLHKEQIELITESMLGSQAQTNEENQDVDILMNVLENMSDLSSGASQFLRLMGEYELNFAFTPTAMRINLEDVFKIFAECSAMNPDEPNDNEPLEAPFDFDELITSNDIDDAGRIKIKNPDNEGEDEDYVDEEGDDEDYEEEGADEEMEEDDENGDGMMGKGKQGNGHGMDLE